MGTPPGVTGAEGATYAAGQPVLLAALALAWAPGVAPLPRAPVRTAAAADEVAKVTPASTAKAAVERLSR
jgi:hypothetical protein